jgi:hypothetical protein
LDGADERGIRDVDQGYVFDAIEDETMSDCEADS